MPPPPIDRYVISISVSVLKEVMRDLAAEAERRKASAAAVPASLPTVSETGPLSVAEQAPVDTGKPPAEGEGAETAAGSSAPMEKTALPESAPPRPRLWGRARRGNWLWGAAAFVLLFSILLAK